MIPGIPFERYLWIANSFRDKAWDDWDFVNMLCNLVQAGVPTVIVQGLNGPIVVTWQKKPADA